MSGAYGRPDAPPAPEALAVIEAYFARVSDALLSRGAAGCEDAVADLRAHVFEELVGGAGTPADAERVLAELGAPESLARECAEAWGGGGAARALRSSGRVLGMPYELLPPTAERVASRWWDPMNPHIIVPRLFGLGWTVNFGALAVALGLVRPDDEDVPFGEVPGTWLALALVLPLALTLGLAVLIAAYQGGLPDRVAIHFGLTGTPDGFAAKGPALLAPLGMTAFGVGLALWAWLRRRPPLARAAAGALASMLAALSVAVYGQEVAVAHGVKGIAILLSGIAVSLVLPFALLVVLSRVGRAAEQRRDLGTTSRRGSL